MTQITIHRVIGIQQLCPTGLLINLETELMGSPPPEIRSPNSAQRFLAAFGPIRDHFHPKQHQLTAQRYRQQLHQRFPDWREVAGLKTAT